MKKVFAPIILLFGVIFFASGILFLQVDNQTALFSAFVGAALIFYAFYLFRQTSKGAKRNGRDEIIEKVRARVESQYDNEEKRD